MGCIIRSTTGRCKRLMNGCALSFVGKKWLTISKNIWSHKLLKEPLWANPRFNYDIPSHKLTFHVISINLVGNFPTAIGGHSFILIAVDHLNKWIEAFSSFTANAKNFSLFFLKFLFSSHGSPHVLLSNKGLNFTSQVVTKLSNIFGACTTLVADYHPATNRVL